VTVVRKLAVLATHPVQYQCPLWASVSRSRDLKLKVFFGSDFSIRGYTDTDFTTHVAWSQDLLQGFDYVFTGDKSWHPLLFRAGKSLYDALDAYQPTDILLNAYLPLFYWQGLRWACQNQVRVHFRGDTTDVDRRRGRVAGLLRNLVLDHFYGHVDAFCAVGEHSREHYLARGIAARRITESPFCVDTMAIESLFENCRHRRSELRAALGLDDSDFVLVFSGKLIEKKDPLTLLEAVASLPSVGNRVLKLLVMGDGPLRQQCELKAKNLCPGRAIFLGFRGQSQLGCVYGAADALVLPSVRSETWGLVVNEALQFGLPCIVSDRVGCKDDLVVDGRTGESFPHGNTVELRAAILRLVSWVNGRRNEVASQCRQAISANTLESAAMGIVAAVLNAHGE
jgi:glycosyltransferase involved in cell wall biosynthesis